MSAHHHHAHLFRVLIAGAIVVSALPAGLSLATRPSAVASPTTRIAGADRYATAVAVSQSYFSGPVQAVVVASGDTFPDGLTGAPLAAALKAPVLLVQPDAIPDTVKAELERLAPERIIILGGPGAVSRAVGAALAGYAGQVDRVAGTDRYATSAAVSAATFRGRVETAYVAMGANFPDALTGAAVAAGRGQPILLVKSDSLPSPVATELRRLAPKRIVIVGGSTAVSNRVAAQLGRLATTVVRTGAADRYTTAAGVSATSFPPGRGGSAFIVGGMSFSDAEAAAPIAGAMNAPLLLTKRDALPVAVRTELERLRPDHIVVVGGPDEVSEKLMAELSTLVRLRISSPGETETPTPGATPTVTLAPTATLRPTAKLRPSPTLAPTPTRSAAPAPTASQGATSSLAPPPALAGIVGYGASTTGGTGGTVTNVTSLSQLRALVKASGKRILILPRTRQTWDLAGTDLDITQPNVTLDGGGIIFKGAMVKILTSQVILQNVTSHPGDVTGNAADNDAFTVNGYKVCRDHIVFNHVEGIWGPDVGGLTLLGCVHDVTAQYSIFGEGLVHSAHAGSGTDPAGHSYSSNIADNFGNPANRVTYYRNLITTGVGRNPRFVGATCTDVIDSVFYNYSDGPSGNPTSLNLIGDSYKKGPAPAAAGLPFKTLAFRYSKDADFYNTLIPASTYLSGNQAIGFTFGTPKGDSATVLRSTPKCAPSVASSGAASGYAAVTTQAGPVIRSDQTQRLLNNVRNGTGVYYNGQHFAALNPTWP